MISLWYDIYRLGVHYAIISIHLPKAYLVMSHRRPEHKARTPKHGQQSIREHMSTMGNLETPR